MLACNREPVILTYEQLEYLLKSFGHYRIDVCKYMGNACILQSNILNGDVDGLKLPDDIESIFNFLTDNDYITDVNVLAKKFVDCNQKFAKKNKSIKNSAYQTTKNKMKSVQMKNLLHLYDLTNK